MISICLLTLNRKKELQESLIRNLASMDYKDYELLICDNGSSDDSLIKWCSELPNLSYHRINSTNEGVASSFNQLMIRAKGDYICLLGNDIIMPEGWAKEMIAYAQGVKDSGIIGVECTAPIPPLSTLNGIHAHYLAGKIDRVFGTMVFRKEVLDLVGGFCELYCPYGLEDSDFNERVNRSGLISLYVPNMKSLHLCNDFHEKTEYREMKNKSLKKNEAIFLKRINEFHIKGYFEKLPEKKKPI